MSSVTLFCRLTLISPGIIPVCRGLCCWMYYLIDKQMFRPGWPSTHLGMRLSYLSPHTRVVTCICAIFMAATWLGDPVYCGNGHGSLNCSVYYRKVTVDFCLSDRVTEVFQCGHAVTADTGRSHKFCTYWSDHPLMLALISPGNETVFLAPFPLTPPSPLSPLPSPLSPLPSPLSPLPSPLSPLPSFPSLPLPSVLSLQDVFEDFPVDTCDLMSNIYTVRKMTPKRIDFILYSDELSTTTTLRLQVTVHYFLTF